MATSPASIATPPKTMPANAVRGLLASPRVTRRRAMSPVTTDAIPRGTPISNQQVRSAITPRISEATPNWFCGASGRFMRANSRRRGPALDPASPYPLQLRQPWRISLGPQRRTGLAGQFSRAAEQSVQQQRSLHVAMQHVFGSEADTAEHLLAVACGGKCRLTRRGLRQ